MTTQDMLWIAAAAMAGVALIAILADRSRGRRRDLDRPGFMPWALIQVIAALAAVVAAALALKLR